MTDIDDWPKVAQIPGDGAGSSPPLPTPVAAAPGAPAALLATPGAEPTPPPRADGTLVCGDRACRADVRKAPVEGRARPVLVDADATPAGTLVWRRDSTGRFVLHEIGRREQVDPETRRFRFHAETCTSPAAVAKREQRAQADELAKVAAVFETAGLTVEVVPVPAHRARPAPPVRPRPAPAPLAKVIDLDSRRKREPPPSRHKCMTPGHEDIPARLYPGGTFCPECVGRRDARGRA